MKLQILLVIILKFTAAQNIIDSESDSKLIAKVILDFTEIFVSNKNHIKIFTSKTSTDHQNDIIQEISKKNQFSISIERKIIKNDKQTLLRQNFDTIALFDSIEVLNFYTELYLATINRDHHSKILVYCANTKFIDFQNKMNLKLFSIYQKVSMHNLYFLLNEKNRILLLTFDWFSKNDCEGTKIKVLNLYDKKLQKWFEKLKKDEKFSNFFGCEIIFGVPVTRYGLKGAAYLKQNGTEVNFSGFSVDFVKLLSNYFNYKFKFQAIELNKNYEMALRIHPDGTYKMPHIFLYLIEPESRNSYLSISSFIEAKIKIFITPSEFYSSYDKILMPFDSTTWILLILTFVIAFVVIGALNFAKRTIQDLVYGKGVKIPAFNVISIFFGTALTKLPDKFFARFILILFVGFCLVFRTAYQGVHYELMTSQIRHPMPQKISDLIDYNYTVYAVYYERSPNDYEIFHDGRSLKVKHVLFEIIQEIYLNYFDNTSAKIALILDEQIPVNFHVHLNHDHKWFVLDENYERTHFSLGFIRSTFFYDQMQRVFPRLVSSGIINYIYKQNMIKSLKFSMKKIYGKIPQIFTLDDLTFGFVIWLGTLSLAFVVFLIEFCTWPFLKRKRSEKKLRKLKYSKVGPILGNCDEFEKSFNDKDKFRVKGNEKFNVDKISFKSEIHSEKFEESLSVFEAEKVNLKK
ncbi:hypothetical protein PVAND_001428 [Polypedilum vanderplanki]|uniref:Ionotropic receptor n=1 Tax=Polypedilum vanderplanki TaxID=319348 RepID=A0A9J6BP81_POLVA|nr:hypothetical protein PVAND_001428 [Polypedilum vanderplanki]